MPGCTPLKQDVKPYSQTRQEYKCSSNLHRSGVGGMPFHQANDAPLHAYKHVYKCMGGKKDAMFSYKLSLSTYIQISMKSSWQLSNLEWQGHAHNLEVNIRPSNGVGRSGGGEKETWKLQGQIVWSTPRITKHAPRFVQSCHDRIPSSQQLQYMAFCAW